MPARASHDQLRLTVSNMDALFEECFADDPGLVRAREGWRKTVTYTDQCPLLLCVVAKDISPRHPRFEYLRDLGSAMIEPILLDRPIPTIKRGGTVSFYFPERWLTRWEEQRFVFCVWHHRSMMTLGRVNILTAGPLIVGDFVRESVRILQNDELRTEQEEIWRAAHSANSPNS
jgi:hypothetical protein